MKLHLLALLALAPAALSQVTVTERFDIDGSSFDSPLLPGQIVQRLYTGHWTLDYKVSGLVYQGDPTVPHDLLITGNVGSGEIDFGTSGILTGGPFGETPIGELFSPVRVMQPVERIVTLQGARTAEDMPNSVSSTQSRESWNTVVNYSDYPAIVDGAYGPNNGGTGQPSLLSARYTGFVDLVIDLFPYPNQTTVCSGTRPPARYPEEECLPRGIGEP